MTRFAEGQTVRVKALKKLSRKISGTQGVLRQPAVGDEAEVVDATRPIDPAVPQVVTAAMIDEQGRLIWQADFEPDELERVA